MYHVGPFALRQSNQVLQISIDSISVTTYPVSWLGPRQRLASPQMSAWELLASLLVDKDVDLSKRISSGVSTDIFEEWDYLSLLSNSYHEKYYAVNGADVVVFIVSCKVDKPTSW